MVVSAAANAVSALDERVVIVERRITRAGNPV
jgi:hypothetical protein